MKAMVKGGIDVRKVVRIGNSRGITLPECWITSQYYTLKKLKNGEILLKPTPVE